MSGIFVKAKIRTHIILLTRGEKGKNPELRVGEFKKAMTWWGFDFTILNFPDRELSFLPIKEIVLETTKIIDRQMITSLMSFSPFEQTVGFDHPDHNVAGEVTRLVSVAMGGKRGLWLWRSSGKSSLLDDRVAYVRRFYPSQDIPKRVLSQIGESYLKVR
ncbi:PIG-L family deacetylase [Candidatus Shapirobacteria bacterium]|nr:PIG-L family deacetylase [Candidatus Shapirobacteria bacterium]